MTRFFLREHFQLINNFSILMSPNYTYFTIKPEISGLSME